MELIEKASDYSAYIQMAGTLIAAIISAYALIKVNRANISERQIVSRFFRKINFSRLAAGS